MIETCPVCRAGSTGNYPASEISRQTASKAAAFVGCFSGWKAVKPTASAKGGVFAVVANW